MSEEEKKGENTLNMGAKEFVPSKNRVPQKLDFNLEAKEYKPKPPKEKIEYVEADDDDDEDNDEQVKEQIDMMMHDEIENEVMDELANQGKLGDSDDSADEDKWLPKYKDCECCHGFVYKCSGEACNALGQCYCKMKDDVDDDDNENKENKEKEKEKEQKICKLST